jgi:DHA1 family tetracycline resistance protein-like MFS transporter
MIVQGGLIKPAVAWLGERRALAVGLLFGAAGFAIYGLAPNGRIFLIAIPVMALWGLAGPSAQSLMTRRVSGSEQGRLQGANASLTAIAGIFGPIIFSHTFAAFIGPLPGAPFLLAAALMLAACAIAWAATRPR